MSRISASKFTLLSVLLCIAAKQVIAVETSPSRPKQGAALLKTDLMAVFAHPDDETGMAATLAYYARGKTSVVTTVYCTRGEGGGNMVGTQSGASLGALREAELRDCLAVLGVKHCYFLDQLDWAYTESIAATFRKWGKEQTLERLVRLVRLLQPEVILTMNPAPLAGQHGHHQAAGVLATEAFTAAADAQRFPLQLSEEGLTVWQPRKLFFAGANSNQPIATIEVNSPVSGETSPAQLAAQALAHHRSQGFGSIGSSSWLRRPQRFSLIKSFVPVEGTETNLLAGIPAHSRLIAIEMLQRPSTNSLALWFLPRPAIVNYQRWVQAQHLEHLAVQVQGDLPLVAGEMNVVRLQLANTGPDVVSGNLKASAATGWRIEPANQTIMARGYATNEIVLRVRPPPDSLVNGDLRAVFTASNFPSTVAAGRAHPIPLAHAPRLAVRPTNDGTQRGWEGVPALRITPAHIVQGKIVDASDSSATFRLAHDGTSLFMDVEVKDDAVINNIAPNDIKGHWRSDSVEICLDPTGEAEDTMGCYKLGIIPFDLTGLVRAARDADAKQGPAETTAPGTRLYSKLVPGGFHLQVAIPFQEIGLAPGQRRIGFNMIIYDGDKRDAATGENINKSRIAWSPGPGVQGRPEDWGRVDLE